MTYNISVVTHETVKVLVHLNLQVQLTIARVNQRARLLLSYNVLIYWQGIEPSNVIPNEIEIRLFEIDVAVNDGVLESNDIIICPTNLSNLSTTEAGAIKYATFNLNCPTPLKIKRLYLSSVHIPTPYCTINSSSSIELSELIFLIELATIMTLFKFMAHVGTHLIQNVTVASMPHSGAIVISGDILTVNISNITVLGFLAIAYTNHSDSAPLYGIGTLSGDEQNANVSLSSSPGKQYRASIFSIEHTGLPSKKSINKAQPAIGKIKYNIMCL